MIEIYNDEDRLIKIRDGYVIYTCFETGAVFKFKIQYIDCVLSDLENFKTSGLREYMNISHTSHNNLLDYEIQFLIKELNKYINDESSGTFVKIIARKIDKKDIKKEDLKKMSYKELKTIDKL